MKISDKFPLLAGDWPELAARSLFALAFLVLLAPTWRGFQDHIAAGAREAALLQARIEREAIFAVRLPQRAKELEALNAQLLEAKAAITDPEIKAIFQGALDRGWLLIPARMAGRYGNGQSKRWLPASLLDSLPYFKIHPKAKNQIALALLVYQTDLRRNEAMQGVLELKRDRTKLESISQDLPRVRRQAEALAMLLWIATALALGFLAKAFRLCRQTHGSAAWLLALPALLIAVSFFWPGLAAPAPFHSMMLMPEDIMEPIFQLLLIAAPILIGLIAWVWVEPTAVALSATGVRAPAADGAPKSAAEKRLAVLPWLLLPALLFLVLALISLRADASTMAMLAAAGLIWSAWRLPHRARAAESPKDLAASRPPERLARTFDTAWAAPAGRAFCVLAALIFLYSYLWHPVKIKLSDVEQAVRGDEAKVEEARSHAARLSGLEQRIDLIDRQVRDIAAALPNAEWKEMFHRELTSGHAYVPVRVQDSKGRPALSWSDRRGDVVPYFQELRKHPKAAQRWDSLVDLANHFRWAHAELTDTQSRIAALPRLTERLAAETRERGRLRLWSAGSGALLAAAGIWALILAARGFVLGRRAGIHGALWWLAWCLAPSVGCIVLIASTDDQSWPAVVGWVGLVFAGLRLQHRAKEPSVSGYPPWERLLEWQSGRWLRASVRFELPFVNEFLSASLKRGLPLPKSLEVYAAQLRGRRLRELFTALAAALAGGKSFSAALGAYPGLFPTSYVALIKVGEAMDDLPRALELSSASLQKELERRTLVQSTLAYPAIVGSIMTFVTLFLFVFVVPTFAQIWRSFGASMPFLTQLVIDISALVKHEFVPLVLLGAAAIVAAYRRPAALRNALAKLPLLGALMRQEREARLCRLLSDLLKSGCAVDEALRLCGDALEDEALSRGLEKARQRARQGAKLSEALAAGGFSKDLAWVAAMGEQRENLPESLAWLADHGELQVRARIDYLTPLLERSAVVVMGLTVGTIVIAMFMPMFGLGGLAAHLEVP